MVGDWNRDGATEVLVLGDKACWIFTLTLAPEGSGGGRLVVVLVAMLALFVFFSHLQLETVSAGYGGGRGGSTSRRGGGQWKGGKKYVARLPRSTD